MLKISVLAQSNAVFQAQSPDFMKSNWDTVDGLLQNGINVAVYNGNEDLICDTIGTQTILLKSIQLLGTMKWVNRLTWTGLSSFNTSRRIAFGTKSFPLAGYHKTYKNFQFWWLLRGGHMVAYDVPEATIYMVKQIIQNT